MSATWFVLLGLCVVGIVMCLAAILIILKDYYACWIDPSKVCRECFNFLTLRTRYYFTQPNEPQKVVYSFIVKHCLMCGHEELVL